MNSFRIITGRAGTGKSSYCIEQMAEYIKNRNCEIGEAPAFLIVPEQFSVNSEKRLIEEANLPGLLIDEVLSFRRAACRVLGRLGGLKYEFLSSSGKVMLLTQAIRNLSDELVFYKAYSSKPRGMEMILSLIEEFGRYGATADKLIAVAEKNDADELLKMKLSDLSKIYAEYRKLTNEKFYDTETLYNDFVTELPTDEMFKNSHVWIDGFNGFTSQEFDIISALMDVCDELCISVCADLSSEKLFDNSNNTYKKLLRIAENKGIKPEIHVMCENGEVPLRFKKNEYLAHLEKNYGVHPYVKMDGAESGISICECQNRYYEVETAAKKINSFISEGYNYSDIIVVSGNIDSYKNIIASVFSMHRLPFFVDQKRQISGHPLVRYIIDLLELISSNWSYTAVFSFLKTGLYETDMKVVDVLENKILASGIKGKNGITGWSKYIEKCKEKIAEASEKGQMYRIDNSAYLLAVKLFTDIETFRENIKSCKVVSDCCDEIINFLVKTEIYEKVSKISADLRKSGNLDKADEYSAIWNITMDVLHQVDTFLGDTAIRGVNVKASYIADILSNGFAQYKAGFIPHSSECIQIGTPERSKSLNPKVMILLGANEGVFPATIKDSGLLNDNDRDFLLHNGIELSDDNKKRALYADFVMYTVLTTPSEKMCITYALSSTSGDALRPSSVVRMIRKIFPGVITETGSSEFTDPRKSKFVSQEFFESDTDISEIVAQKVLGFDDIGTTMSVSRLEKYNNCPYSYLLDSCFRLKARDEFEMEVSDTGSLRHGLIELSFKKVMENNSLKDEISADECDGVIESVFNDAIEGLTQKTDVFLGSERNIYIADCIKNAAKKELKNLLDQLKVNQLKPIGFEVEYGYDSPESLPSVIIECDDGFKVSLKGKIDRIDAGLLRTEDLPANEETPVYFRVVDYKSSIPDMSISDIVSGERMQLMFYISAVKNGLATRNGFENKKIIPASAVYYGFSNENIKLKVRGDSDVDSFSEDHLMQGMYLQKDNALEALHGGVCSRTYKSIAVPEGGFEKLMSITQENIINSIANMRAGHFPAKPLEGLSACKYCDFKSVCRVNSDNEKNIRKKKYVSKDDFWDDI